MTFIGNKSHTSGGYNIINIQEPITETPEHMKQMEGEIDNSIIVVVELNTPFPIMDITSRQKTIRK